MSTTQLATSNPQSLAVELALIGGDLAKLTPDQRLSYYNRVCESLGLNPLTRPFDYLHLSGKLILYARKDCTDQLRAIHGVSVEDLSTMKLARDLHVVKVKVKNRDGRTDFGTGAVSIGKLKGDSLGNAIMKAETKAKRRATLSICGLGWLDETETETVQGAITINGVTENTPMLDHEGKITLPCGLCSKPISGGEWEGHKYNTEQVLILSRKLHEKDMCGDCMSKLKHSKIQVAEQIAETQKEKRAERTAKKKVEAETAESEARINHLVGTAANA